MRRTVLLLATAASAALLGGCGGGQVTVQAQLDNAGENQPLSDLEVWLLPYDRDAIFDSLSQAYGEPEPQVPDSLIALQGRVIEAQRQWQQVQNQWNAIRDSLRQISDAMEGLSRASGEYIALFREFSNLEPQESRLSDQAERLFQQFTDLQSEFTTQSQEIRIHRQNWADEAFAPVDSVIEIRLEQLGLEPQADTTNAAGLAYFTAKPGRWWVYARHELPFLELYWNQPVDVTRGDPVTVMLDRQTAAQRQKF
jgi:hypothetical protein